MFKINAAARLRATEVQAAPGPRGSSRNGNQEPELFAMKAAQLKTKSGSADVLSNQLLEAEPKSRWTIYFLDVDGTRVYMASYGVGTKPPKSGPTKFNGKSAQIVGYGIAQGGKFAPKPSAAASEKGLFYMAK